MTSHRKEDVAKRRKLAVKLRDKQKLTFAEMGERMGIAASNARRIYYEGIYGGQWGKPGAFYEEAFGCTGYAAGMSNIPNPKHVAFRGKRKVKQNGQSNRA